MTGYQLVDPMIDSTALERIPADGTIGVDTEFMREKTYFAELCLVQVATSEEIFCIDPINADEGAWWDLLMSPQWVVHSARQDIEVIHQASGRMPRTLFDTQVAAALLGFQPQVGYAGLVQELFGIGLDKSHTRANWAQRPLPDALLHYAAEDVEHLLPARDELVTRLETKGRLQWALEDSAELLDPNLYSTKPDLAIQKLKGAKNMRGRQRAVARELAAWREREALKYNKPRQWIMRDAVLIEILTTAPGSLRELSRIEGLAERTARRAGKEILDILRQTTDDDNDYRPLSRPDEKQKAALKKMQHMVAACADDLGIAAEIIAPRKDLSAAMLGGRDVRVLRGWRRELIGERLLELL